MAKLSVVFPVFQEMENSLFWSSLGNLTSMTDVQIVVVDGGSSDGTTTRLNELGIGFVTMNDSNRAMRMSKGIEYCEGDWIVLNHPRSEIEPDGIRFVTDDRMPTNWGAFTHVFDCSSLGLRFTSWYSNRIRLRLRSIAYLDHGIVCRSDLLKKTRIPPVDIFEDTYLSRELRQHGKPHLIPFESTTSAIRFSRNGFLKQAIMNQWMKIQFLVGADNKKMNAIYEKGLDLNRD